jgi:hypothetical protein
MPDHSQFNTDRAYPGRWTITFSNPPINMFVPTTIVELGALMTELARRAAGNNPGTSALLGDRLRLAQVRRETERPAAVHHRDRWAGYSCWEFTPTSMGLFHPTLRGRSSVAILRHPAYPPTKDVLTSS